MCTPDTRYKALSVVSGTLTYNASRRELTNKIAEVDADFTLALSNIKHGSVHHLILEKTVPGDVVITTDGADMVLGEGLGATITLSGAANTKYQLVITNDGTANCIRPLGSAVDLSGYATVGYVALAIADKLDKTVNVDNKGTVTTYELSTDDNGKLLVFESGSAIAISCPNDLPIGFNVGIIQDGAGQITFTAEAGGALQNRSSHTKTAGQYSAVSLVVKQNDGGSAAQYNFSGDTSA